MELFLSHATSDASLVDELRARFQAIGVRAYTAEHDGKAGLNVHKKIEDAIQRCDVMVVLLTEAGYNSKYVQQEIGAARGAKKLIVPVVTTAATKQGLGMLEGIEYILVDEADPSVALRSLSARIESLSVQRRRDDLVAAALVATALALLIVVLSE